MTPDDVTVLATKLFSSEGLRTDLRINQRGNGHKTCKHVDGKGNYLPPGLCVGPAVSAFVEERFKLTSCSNDRIVHLFWFFSF